MDVLFSKYDLNQTLANQTQRLRDHINKLDENYLLGVSEDDLTTYLVQEFSLEPIELGEPFVADSHEVDIDVSHDPLRRNPFGRPSIAKGVQIHVKVPYTGDGSLFWFQPSHISWSPPRGTVTKEYLEFIIRGEHLVGERVRQDLNSVIREIRGYLDDIRTTCKTHNASLDQKIRQMLKMRKERLLSNRNLVASIGLPIQSRPDAPRTYAVPNVRRKPAIKPPVVIE
jgi:hypothetical protein